MSRLRDADTSLLGGLALACSTPPFIVVGLALIPGGGAVAAGFAVGVVVLIPVSLISSAALAAWALAAAVSRRRHPDSVGMSRRRDIALPLAALLTGTGGLLALGALMSTAT